jgi:hypothetical protein
MKAPTRAGRIRQLLLTLVVSAVAWLLIMVVMSLSVGSSLPGTSLRVYLNIGAYDRSKDGTHADFLEPNVTGDTDTRSKTFFFF